MQKLKIKKLDYNNHNHRLYTINDISKITGVPTSTIRAQLKKLDLPNTFNMQQIKIELKDDPIYYFDSTMQGVLYFSTKKIGKTWVFLD